MSAPDQLARLLETTFPPDVPAEAAVSIEIGSVRRLLADVSADRREAEKGHTPCSHGHYFYCGDCGPEPFNTLNREKS